MVTRLVQTEKHKDSHLDRQMNDRDSKESGNVR